jgi:hypothetical protein
MLAESVGGQSAEDRDHVLTRDTHAGGADRRQPLMLDIRLAAQGPRVRLPWRHRSDSHRQYGQADADRAVLEATHVFEMAASVMVPHARD